MLRFALKNMAIKKIQNILIHLFLVEMNTCYLTVSRDLNLNTG